MPVHTSIDEAIPGDICGFDATVHETGVETTAFDVAPDGMLVGIRETSNIKETWSNGTASLVFARAGVYRGVATGDLNGIVTTTETLAGLQERIYQPGGPTITRDAGTVTTVTVIDFSTDPQGKILSQTITENGPHPGDNAGFCHIVDAVFG